MEVKDSIKKLNKLQIILVCVITLVFMIILIIFLRIKPKLELEYDQISIQVYSEYKKPNMTAKYLGVDITDNIVENGFVDTSLLGEYLLTYTVQEGISVTEKTLKVIVNDDEPPILTLNGDITQNTCNPFEYEEQGYQAIDNYDKDITDKVEIVKDNNKITYQVEDSSGNVSVAIRNFKTCEQTSDKKEEFYLNLFGSQTLYVPLNSEYVEYSAEAYDDTDGYLKVEIAGKVDTSLAGLYEVSYSATNSKGQNITKVREVYVFNTDTIQNLTNGEKGVIYLTFDDGPGQYTEKILDILSKYNIKATFFVTSAGSDEIIKKEYDAGHSIGLHTSTHKWNIYSSEETYFEDLEQVSDRVESIINEKSYLIRFPGGSSNTVSKKYKKGIMTSLTSSVLKKGYHYFDWNVSVEDAGVCTKQKTYEKKQECILNYFKKGLSFNRSNVVLMHDIKKYTADTLENMITYAIEQGYTFDKITMETEQVHSRINN